jgi:hypothetical protein
VQQQKQQQQQQQRAKLLDAVCMLSLKLIQLPR